MQAAAKTIKRRVIQKAAETLGRAEHVAADEDEFKRAVRDFRALEHEIELVIREIRSMRVATARMTETHLHLAESMVSYFARYPESPMARPVVELMRDARRAHRVVQRSAGKIVELEATEPLLAFLRQKVPEMKDKISRHQGLETDLSAYVRKVKALESRPLRDAERAKFTDKRDRTLAKYDFLHRSLLRELQDMHAHRDGLMRHALTAILAARAESMAQWSSGAEQVLRHMESPAVVELTRDSIRTLISMGGPAEGNVLTDAMSVPRASAPPGRGLLRTGLRSLSFSASAASSDRGAPSPLPGADGAVPVANIIPEATTLREGLSVPFASRADSSATQTPRAEEAEPEEAEPEEAGAEEPLMMEPVLDEAAAEAQGHHEHQGDALPPASLASGVARLSVTSDARTSLYPSLTPPAPEGDSGGAR